MVNTIFFAGNENAFKEENFVPESAGAADDGKVPVLDATGKLDESFLYLPTPLGMYYTHPLTRTAYNLETLTNNKLLLANGQYVSRTTYADLFAVLGTTYGTDTSDIVTDAYTNLATQLTSPTVDRATGELLTILTGGTTARIQSESGGVITDTDQTINTALGTNATAVKRNGRIAAHRTSVNTAYLYNRNGGNTWDLLGSVAIGFAPSGDPVFVDDNTFLIWNGATTWAVFYWNGTTLTKHATTLVGSYICVFNGYVVTKSTNNYDMGAYTISAGAPTAYGSNSTNNGTIYGFYVDPDNTKLYCTTSNGLLEELTIGGGTISRTTAKSGITTSNISGGSGDYGGGILRKDGTKHILYGTAISFPDENFARAVEDGLANNLTVPQISATKAWWRLNTNPRRYGVVYQDFTYPTTFKLPTVAGDATYLRAK